VIDGQWHSTIKVVTRGEHEAFEGAIPAASLVAIVASTLAACGGQKDSTTPPDAAALRLYVFDCGTLKADPARFRLKPDEVATTDLSVPCFLVVHPRGKLMWDPGAVPDAAWTPTGGPVTYHLALPDGSERDLTLRKRLGTQLAEVGYAPKDIEYVAFSHYRRGLIEAFLTKTGAQLWIQHDSIGNSRLKKAP
jgi:N-acyl homoserine lactone hydrolase